MARHLGKTRALTIEASTSACAHLCRYCSIGDRAGAFPVQDWMDFVERFRDWSTTAGPPGLHVHGGFPGPSFNFDLDTFVAVDRWHERMTGQRLSWIPLGGMKMMSPAQMRRWLQERQGVGVQGVSAAFVGRGSVHDRWNGRRGDYDFLMRTLRTAAEIGLQHGATIYVTRSTLPLLDELVAELDALPTPHSGRHVRPFYYIGHGGHHDEERLVEGDLERIPVALRQMLQKSFDSHSEREWIQLLPTRAADPDLYLHLELTRRNFAGLRRRPCADLFADLDGRARSQWEDIPDLHELCDGYADPQSRRLYTLVDIERLWVERFLERHPHEIDRSLLHYHLGRSVRPPSLWKAGAGSGEMAAA